VGSRVFSAQAREGKKERPVHYPSRENTGKIPRLEDGERRAKLPKTIPQPEVASVTGGGGCGQDPGGEGGVGRERDRRLG